MTLMRVLHQAMQVMNQIKIEKKLVGQEVTGCLNDPVFLLTENLWVKN